MRLQPPSRRVRRLVLAALMAGGLVRPHPAAANCALVGMGASLSLMTCSNGIRGTATDLGGGLLAYRLSNGASGILNLHTSATAANQSNGSGTSTSTSAAGTNALTAVGNQSSSSAGVAGSSDSGSSISQGSVVAVTLPSTADTGAGIAYIVNGAAPTLPGLSSSAGLNPAAPAKPANPPLTPPVSPMLTPPMGNEATAMQMVPAPKPSKPMAASDGVQQGPAQAQTQ